MALKKEEFLSKLQNREGYLYQVGVLATANDNYEKWACEYLKSEMEEKDGQWSLKNISQITREKTYNLEHDIKEETGSKREEEWFVIRMFQDETDIKNIFGRKLAYQVPLKNTKYDKGVGKIDYVYEKDGCFHLAEIKGKHSNESILKAIIEIQTYYQIVNKEKLLNNFADKLKGLDIEHMPIKKTVVIFENTKAHKQLEKPNIQELLQKFEIEVIVLQTKESFIQIN